MEMMQNMLDMYRIVENGPRRNAIHQQLVARAMRMFAPQLRSLRMWRCHHLTLAVTPGSSEEPLSVSGDQCCWWPSSCGLSLLQWAKLCPLLALHLDLQQRQLSLNWWAPTTYSTITSPARPDDESSSLRLTVPSLRCERHPPSPLGQLHSFSRRPRLIFHLHLILNTRQDVATRIVRPAGKSARFDAVARYLDE